MTKSPFVHFYILYLLWAKCGIASVFLNSTLLCSTRFATVTFSCLSNRSLKTRRPTSTCQIPTVIRETKVTAKKRKYLTANQPNLCEHFRRHKLDPMSAICKWQCRMCFQLRSPVKFSTDSFVRNVFRIGPLAVAAAAVVVADHRGGNLFYLSEMVFDLTNVSLHHKPLAANKKERS